MFFWTLPLALVFPFSLLSLAFPFSLSFSLSHLIFPFNLLSSVLGKWQTFPISFGSFEQYVTSYPILSFLLSVFWVVWDNFWPFIPCANKSHFLPTLTKLHISFPFTSHNDKATFLLLPTQRKSIICFPFPSQTVKTICCWSLPWNSSLVSHQLFMWLLQHDWIFQNFLDSGNGICVSNFYFISMCPFQSFILLEVDSWKI